MGLERAAHYIADWSPSTGLTYQAFLQAKEFETSFRFAINDQTLKLVGSNEQLAKRGFKLLDQTLRDNTRILSRDIAGVERSIRSSNAEVAEVMRWGFAVLTTGVREMNDSLAEIKRLIANPTSTWACERFDKGRDEYGRGLYREALKSVNQAIAGYGSNPGWDSEFRFHYLLGRILIGSWLGGHKNISSDVVDPEAAEQAFLNAARYHRGGDHGAGRTLSLLLAGRAAFLHTAFDRAVAHTEHAINSIVGVTPEVYAAARYQQARYLCVRGGDDATATTALISAFETDLDLVVEAATDPDFINRRNVLDDALAEVTARLRKKYLALRHEFDASLKAYESFSFDGTTADALLHEELMALAQLRGSQVREAASGRPLDFDSAIKMIELAQPRFEPLLPAFRKRFAEDRTRKWQEMSVTKDAREARDEAQRCNEICRQARLRQEKAVAARGGGQQLKLGCGLYILISAILGVASLIWSDRSSNTVIAVVFWGVIALGLLGWYVRTRSDSEAGYEGIRSLELAASRAEALAKRKTQSATEAWQVLEKSIQELATTSPLK